MRASHDPPCRRACSSRRGTAWACPMQSVGRRPDRRVIEQRQQHADPGQDAARTQRLSGIARLASTQPRARSGLIGNHGRAWPGRLGDAGVEVVAHRVDAVGRETSVRAGSRVDRYGRFLRSVGPSAAVRARSAARATPSTGRSTRPMSSWSPATSSSIRPAAIGAIRCAAIGGCAIALCSTSISACSARSLAR